MSALLTRDPGSPPARIVHLARIGALWGLTSTAHLDECREVLLRPRLQQRHRRSADEIDGLLEEIKGHSLHVNPPDDPPEGPDPDDAHLWRLLQIDPSAILITGDQALIDSPPAWATVATPRAWLDRFFPTRQSAPATRDTDPLPFRRITIRTDQMDGAPCIRGMRMPVVTVVRMVANGLSTAEILNLHPELEAEDVREALLYAAAAAHRGLPLASNE